MKGITVGKEVRCETEYTTLNKVLVARPTFMRISKVINETQKHYQESNIDALLAQEQHEVFVKVLKENGIEVMELPTDPRLPEQVFTLGYRIHRAGSIVPQFDVRAGPGEGNGCS